MKLSRRRKIFACLVVVWMIVIFAFSAKPGDESENQSIQAGKVVCDVFVPGYDSMSETQQYDLAKSIDYPVRKAAHMTEYAILAGLILGTISAGMANVKTCVISVVAAFAYASTDEIHQLFVAGRSGAFKDVLIDTAGAIISMCLIYGITRAIKHFANRNES